MDSETKKELLAKISFESSDSFLKSKNEKIEDFEQTPLVFFITIEDEAEGEESSWCKTYRVYDDLNDESLLCTCPTSSDVKRDETFEKNIKENINANEHKISLLIMNWIRNKLGYNYVVSLKIDYDYQIKNYLSLTLIATGLKRKKTKSTPPLPIKLPPATE